MRLVMIHGRAQEGKDPVALEKEWLDALAYGLARAGRALPPGTTVEFPFYGDLLVSLVNQVNTPLASDVGTKGTDTDPDQEWRGEILEEIAQAAGLTQDEIARVEFNGLAQERGPANWEWVQSVLRGLDRIPGINAKAIDQFTRDVYVYLSKPGVRAQIDNLVRKAIGSDPCIVLAHSLGTVVAYNVLATRPALPNCARFVTVGSPLGIKGIKQFLDKPLKSPPGFGHWFNAFDQRDVVALHPLDGTHFPVAPAIESYDQVNNFTENRHGIAGYLADPKVAAKIAEFL